MKIIYAALLLTFCSCSAMRVNRVIKNIPCDTSYIYEDLQIDTTMLVRKLERRWYSNNRQAYWRCDIKYNDFISYFRYYDENGNIVALYIKPKRGDYLALYYYDELGNLIENDDYASYPICWQRAYELGQRYDHRLIKIREDVRNGNNIGMGKDEINGEPVWRYAREYDYNKYKRIFISVTTGKVVKRGKSFTVHD